MYLAIKTATIFRSIFGLSVANWMNISVIKATCPKQSVVPRPYKLSSSMVSLNGSRSHVSGFAGTTSKWLPIKVTVPAPFLCPYKISYLSKQSFQLLATNYHAIFCILCYCSIIFWLRKLWWISCAIHILVLHTSKSTFKNLKTIETPSPINISLSTPFLDITKCQSFPIEVWK